MLEFYRELFRREQDGFEIIVDYTYDHIHPAKVFNPKNYNLDLMLAKIDDGSWEYFNLRIRVFLLGKKTAQGIIEHCMEKSVDVMLVRDVDIIEEFIETLILEAKEDLGTF